MQVRTLVVGVDFSPASGVACDQAVGLARKLGARVVLAHVTSSPDLSTDSAESMQTGTTAYQEILRARGAEDRDTLTALRARLEAEGVAVEDATITGFADDALSEAAAARGAELIMVGSQGRRGLGRLLLGSIAERLTRVAGCPVLVARGDGAAADGGYHRIVVGTDWSPNAERGLDLALALAAPGARVELVHFWEMPALSRVHAAKEVDATLAEIRTEHERNAQVRGERALAAHPGVAVDLRYRLTEGDTRDGLLAVAKEIDAQLIVVGANGRRGLRRFLLGSVAESTVRHAACSVLVAR